MGDSALVHVQPEFQAVFKHTTTLFPDGFGLCFGTLDDKHEVIGIPAVRHSRFPLPVFSDSGTSASLDTVIPVPAILSGFPAQVAFMQILIELIEHDIRQQRRYYATLRYAFTCRPKETDINMPGLDGFPQQSHETSVADPAAYCLHQQPMVYSVEVAGQVAFNYPAAPCFTAVGELQFHRADRMVDTAFRPEAI